MRIMYNRLISKRVVNCNREIYNQLYSLNFRSYSLMRKALVEAKKYNTGWVSYIIDNNNKVLAWSMICKFKIINKYKMFFPNAFEIYFYVRKKYRKMGLGKRLYIACNKICSDNNKRMKITRHDEISKQFFKKCREKC